MMQPMRITRQHHLQANGWDCFLPSRTPYGFSLAVMAELILIKRLLSTGFPGTRAEWGGQRDREVACMIDSFCE